MSPSQFAAVPDEFNAATYFIDRHIAEGRGHKLAIECGKQSVTYQQLFETVNRVGNRLRKLGVRMEERVFLLLLDTPEFAASFFGAIKIGAVPVPTNTLLKAADYQYLLNDSRARVCIVSEVLLPLIKAIPRRKAYGFLETTLVVGAETWPARSISRMRYRTAIPRMLSSTLTPSSS
jgi:acyl-coenzyme A synthetase/AMP-(fatty) acid ligase